jgi:hypothetical protein
MRLRDATVPSPGMKVTVRQDRKKPGSIQFQISQFFGSKMGGKFVKKTVWTILCLIALCGTNLFAQKIVKVGNLKAVHSPVTAQARVAAPDAPAALKKIFSNLGPKKNAYNAFSGWLLAGPLNTQTGTDQFFGLPFTPKANAHVSQLQAALQYLGSGANQVNLSLYTDAGGLPGTLIGGPVTVMNLSNAGTCCALAIANLPTSVAVTAGTQYWVVADTPLTGTGSDLFGAWEWVAVTPYQAAIVADGGWFSFNGFEENPAGAVFGTLP